MLGLRMLTQPSIMVQAPQGASYGPFGLYMQEVLCLPSSMPEDLVCHADGCQQPKPGIENMI